jgi:heme exporter protein A
MNTRFSAHGLCIWRGDRCLCRDLDFSLEQGEALQLAGPNGSGKTTLLRVLTGLGRLDAGEIRWNDVPIRKAPDYLAGVAYLAHANGLKSQLTTRENIKFYQAISEYSSGVTADEVLELMGLTEVADRPCGLLSMGQRRRAALARLPLSQAQLWFLDEPLTSLDVKGIALVGELLERHLMDGGLAIYATHQAIPFKASKPRILELGEAD